jgi:hypothetical protein
VFNRTPARRVGRAVLMPYVVTAVCQLAAELYLERMTGVVVHHDVHDLPSPPTWKVISGKLSSRLYTLSRLCESRIPEDEISHHVKNAMMLRVSRVLSTHQCPGSVDRHIPGRKLLAEELLETHTAQSRLPSRLLSKQRSCGSIATII